jgi:succinate-semialdehyde dehydrogenase
MADVKAYIEELVAKARVAQKKFYETAETQEDVDKIVRAIGKTCYDNREMLGQMAHEETGYGTTQQKIGKIIATTTTQWNIMRGRKSMGEIENIRKEPGVRVFAKPIGVVGCICPATNPVITIAANGMMAIKCRNAAIIAGHPAAKKTTEKVVSMIREEFEKLGAPADLIQCIDAEHSSLEATSALLSSTDVNIATGGPGMVKAVYSCGKPGFGVGQGNTQEIYAPDWTDWEAMAASSVNNRAFDYGVPCTGEQMLHIPADQEEAFLAAWKKAGAFLIESKEDIDKLRELIFPNGGGINRKVVGQSPKAVGAMVGIDVPDGTISLLAKVETKGADDDLCREILFPFERYRTYTDFKETVDVAVKNLEREGAGHNSAIMTNDKEMLDYAANKIPVCRLNHNQNTFGFNNGVPTTSTLGCGFWSGNSISENLAWYHLYQTTRVTETLPNKRTWKDGDWDSLEICPVVE